MPPTEGDRDRLELEELRQAILSLDDELIRLIGQLELDVLSAEPAP